jgi:hypothetical protein
LSPKINLNHDQHADSDALIMIEMDHARDRGRPHSALLRRFGPTRFTVAKQAVRESAVIRILPLVGIIGLMLYTFFDVLSTDRRRFTSLSKGLWLLVALLPVIGGMLWIVVGKPRKPRGESVISLHRRDRPVAPDDDPEFLRRLDEQAWRAKRESARRSGQPQAADAAPHPADDTAPPEPDVAESADPDEGAEEPGVDPTPERAPGDDDEPPPPAEKARPRE